MQVSVLLKGSGELNQCGSKLKPNFRTIDLNQFGGGEF